MSAIVKKWAEQEHYFARGTACWARGHTIEEAIRRARSMMPADNARSPWWKARRVLAAFDVWLVPVGAVIDIDGMGTVTFGEGVTKVQTAKVK